MRKFHKVKSIQLVLFLCLAVFCLLMALSDSRLFHLIASDGQFRIMGILLWLLFGLSFFFIFMDFSLFSSVKRDYRELDFAVSFDPTSGIANRYSCDALISQYQDQPFPPNVGCMMLELTNLSQVNRSGGHEAGNRLIQSFSVILQSAASDLCFVGRNDGNRFLALFESCNPEKLKLFFQRIEKGVENHNRTCEQEPIVYRQGCAFEEYDQTGSVTSLIGLANSRIADKPISDKKEYVSGKAEVNDQAPKSAAKKMEGSGRKERR